jgi:hypothetical protein
MYFTRLDIQRALLPLRNVSGEGHLNGKNPPPKKRVRGFGYRFY